MKPDARRHDLDIAAQCLREAVHFSRLSGPIDLVRGAAIVRTVGGALDDLAFALGRECGHDQTITGEPFWTAADSIATQFEERAREVNSESDVRADRGCWRHHERVGA